MNDMKTSAQFPLKKELSRRDFIYHMAALSISFAGMPLLFPQKAGASPSADNLKAIAQGIVWTGQASVKIPGLGANVYVDPYKIKAEDKADLVLITHSHDDHLSRSSLKKICYDQTTIIAPSSVASKIKSLPQKETIIVKPGDRVSVGDISVDAVPMYNIRKRKYHPKSNHWVGFVMEGKGVRIYHAGDTERIPEMKEIQCDIALLPLGQKYTMNSVKDAAESAMDVQAKLAVPIHFGEYEGSHSDAVKFKKLLEGHMDVVILDKTK